MTGLRAAIATLAAGLAIQLTLANVAGAEQPAVESTSGADHFAGVIIYASDVERSIRFYTEIMGLKIISRVPAKGELAEVLLSRSGTMSGSALLILQPT